jgi:hypothetical protein
MEVYKRWQSEDNLFLAGGCLLGLGSFGLPTSTIAVLLLGLVFGWSWMRQRREAAWTAFQIEKRRVEREAEARLEIHAEGPSDMPELNDAYAQLFGRRLGD